MRAASCGRHRANGIVCTTSQGRHYKDDVIPIPPSGHAFRFKIPQKYLDRRVAWLGKGHRPSDLSLAKRLKVFTIMGWLRERGAEFEAWLQLRTS